MMEIMVDDACSNRLMWFCSDFWLLCAVNCEFISDSGQELRLKTQGEGYVLVTCGVGNIDSSGSGPEESLLIRARLAEPQPSTYYTYWACSAYHQKNRI